MSRTADVAIVGGGAIGCSVAYHAARRGAQVVLHEAERMGASSSAFLYESLPNTEVGMH